MPKPSTSLVQLPLLRKASGLFIGIDRYADANFNLNTPSRDAREIQSVLSGIDGWEKRLTGRLLVSRSDVPDEEADEPDILQKIEESEDDNAATNVTDVTAARVYAGIRWLFENSGECDDLVLYFSGHATSDEFGFRLVTHEAPGSVGGGVHFDTILTAAKNYSRQFETLTIILDCCAAGDAGNVEKSISGIRTALLPENVCILAACAPDQSTNEGTKFSVYTEYILDHLTAGTSPRTVVIDPFALHSSVAARCENDDRPVTPMIKAHLTTIPVLLARAPYPSDRILVI